MTDASMRWPGAGTSPPHGRSRLLITGGRPLVDRLLVPTYRHLVREAASDGPGGRRNGERFQAPLWRGEADVPLHGGWHQRLSPATMEVA